jgi:hypothetical protein
MQLPPNTPHTIHRDTCERLHPDGVLKSVLLLAMGEYKVIACKVLNAWIEWLNGWMDGWMNELMSWMGLMDDWMDDWITDARAGQGRHPWHCVRVPSDRAAASAAARCVWAAARAAGAAGEWALLSVSFSFGYFQLLSLAIALVPRLAAFEPLRGLRELQASGRYFRLVSVSVTFSYFRWRSL